MIAKEKEKPENDLKAKREIHFALALNTFMLVSSCKSSNNIWKHMKELYSRDDIQLHSIQLSLLLEFGSFKKNTRGSINEVSER